MEKVCAKCRKWKFRDDFHNYIGSDDGLNKWCKDCVSKYRKKYFKNNDEVRIRQNKRDLSNYHDNYKGTDELKLRYLKYRQNNAEKIRETTREWNKNNKRDPKKNYQHFKKWVENNRLKRRAQSTLGKRISRGTITKDPCVVCGTTENVQGHHEDYSKPFEVIWLCRKHHWELHKGRYEELRVREIKRLEVKFA